MISIETLRQTIISKFKTAHDANYPTTLVNYPNFTVVDLENQSLPFVNVELSFDNIEQVDLGGTDKEVDPQGRLMVVYYYRENTGTSGAFSYSDMLLNNMVLRSASGVSYGEMKMFNIQTFPGWTGVMHHIPFRVPLGEC